MKKILILLAVLILVGAGCNTISQSDQNSPNFILKVRSNNFVCNDGKVFRAALANVQLDDKKSFVYEGKLSDEEMIKLRELFGDKSINFVGDYKRESDIFSEYTPCPSFQYNADTSARKVREKECNNLIDGFNKITKEIKGSYDYALISIITPADAPYKTLSAYVTKRISNVTYANLFNKNRILYSGYMQTNRANKVIIVKPEDLNPDAFSFAMSEEVFEKGNTSDITFRVASGDTANSDYFVFIRIKKKNILANSYLNLCDLNTGENNKIITNESLDSDGDGVTDEIELMLQRDPFDAKNNAIKNLTD